MGSHRSAYRVERRPRALKAARLRVWVLVRPPNFRSGCSPIAMTWAQC